MAPALPVGSGTPVCTTVGLTLSEARGSGCAPSGCVSGAVTMTDSAAGSMRRRRPGVRIDQAVGPPPVLSQFLRVFGRDGDGGVGTGVCGIAGTGGVTLRERPFGCVRGKVGGRAAEAGGAIVQGGDGVARLGAVVLAEGARLEGGVQRGDELAGGAVAGGCGCGGRKEREKQKERLHGDVQVQSSINERRWCDILTGRYGLQKERQRQRSLTLDTRPAPAPAPTPLLNRDHAQRRHPLECITSKTS